MNDKINFWIYPIEKKYWSEYQQYIKLNKSLHLGVIYNNPMIDKNIVIFYVKSKGFSGLCTINSNYVAEKVNIFKDKNLQKYVLKINKVIIFDQIITVSTVKSNILNKGFKSIQWFSSFIKSNSKLFKMNSDIAKDIIDVLCYQANEKKYNYDSDKKSDCESDGESDSESDSETDTKPNEKSDSLPDNVSDTESDNESDTESNGKLNSKCKKKIKKIPKSDIGSDSYGGIESVVSNIYSDCDNTDKDIEDEILSSCTDNDVSEEEIDIENINGHVPVMILTCKNFEFPEIDCDSEEIDEYGNTEDDNEKCKYFINHIKKCKKCNKINNNGIDFIHFLENAIINYSLLEETSAEYSIIIEYYQSVKKYNSFGDSIEKDTAKIYNIQDDEMYDGCVIVTWASSPID